MGNPDTPAFLAAAARVARHLRLRLEVEGRAGLSAVAAISPVEARAEARPSPPRERRVTSDPQGTCRARSTSPAASAAGSNGASPDSRVQAARAVADLKDDFARARAPAPAADASPDDAETYEEPPAPAPAVHVKGPGLFDQLSPDLEDGSSPEEALRRIADEVAACTRCPELAASRTKTVPGQGSPYARLVFVGEGPGADEDVQGLAFVGRAGQLLTKMIEGIGMTRDEVFIANVIKCRPPGNRNPLPEEEANCAPYLARQLEVLRPKVIVALGGVAAKFLLQTSDGITRLRGRFYPYKGAQLMPTFHPAYLLRNPHDKGKVWDDMKKLVKFLASRP